MAVILNASTSSGFIQTADTSGELNLQSNGTTKLSVLSTGVSGTLVQGTAVASTSGTSIDFTGIPSWVKRVTVMLQGVSGSGTSPFLAQIGAGSVTTSGYTGSTWTAATNYNNSTAGVLLTAANPAAASAYTGVIRFNLLTGNTWVADGMLNNNTPSSAATASMFTGSVALSGSLDRVRITTVGGTDTFDAGSINIQYEG
jgi:hypothetical protein